MDEKKRARKKQLYHDIIKQVEFYFSPANLSKDRFMTRALTENENGIELSVLMTFNKLKCLTNDIHVLIKALRLSETLELTENEMRLKSKVIYKRKENEDECTVYVERLPLDADVDFMKQVFSHFGEIDYVSLPKFHNGKIKGFGFVEFADPSGANRAVEEFKKTGNYLPIDMAPGNLRSICTFDKKTKERLLSSRNRNFDFVECDNMEEDEDLMTVAEEIENVEIDAGVNILEEELTGVADNDTEENDKKRKHKTSPSILERKAKKVKSDSDDTENSEIPETCNINSFENTSNKSVEQSTHKFEDVVISAHESEKEEMIQEDLEMLDQIDYQEDDGSLLKIKKKRRQKKKPKRERLTTNCGLLILSKADWKKLRNKYLNVQWEKMRSLKKHLYKCKHQNLAAERLFSSEPSLSSSIEVPNSVVKIFSDEPVVDIKAFKAEIKSKSDEVINIDLKEGATEIHVRFPSAKAAVSFIASSTQWEIQLIKGEEEQRYWSKIQQDRESKKEKRMKKAGEVKQCNGFSIEEEKSIPKGLRDKPTLDIVPGSVVRIQTHEPIVNIKQFKNDLKMSYKDVIYVDAKEGSCEAFIRLDSAANAQLFLKDSFGSHGKSQVLSGEEEYLYWEKINEDRTNKFNKNIRVNKRGKQKIIKKAEKMLGKHILFDDSEI